MKNNKYHPGKIPLHVDTLISLFRDSIYYKLGIQIAQVFHRSK